MHDISIVIVFCLGAPDHMDKLRCWTEHGMPPLAAAAHEHRRRDGSIQEKCVRNDAGTASRQRKHSQRPSRALQTENCKIQAGGATMDVAERHCETAG